VLSQGLTDLLVARGDNLAVPRQQVGRDLPQHVGFETAEAAVRVEGLGRREPVKVHAAWGEHRPFEWGVGALWDCAPHVCGGGGGCAGGGVPLGAVPVLSWCREVFLGVNNQYQPVHTRNQNHKTVRAQLVCCMCLEKGLFYHIIQPPPPPPLPELKVWADVSLFTHTTNSAFVV